MAKSRTIKTKPSEIATVSQPLLDTHPLCHEERLAPYVPHRPERPVKSEGGVPFKIKSEFTPKGDQPTAIKTLVDGLAEGEQSQVLLGATGTGKTFSIANVIEQTGRPALILAPNKILAAQLYGEFKNFFPDNAVE